MNDIVIDPTTPDAWQDNRLDYIPYHVRSKQVTYTLIYFRHAHDNGVEEAEDVLVCVLHIRRSGFPEKLDGSQISYVVAHIS